MVESNIVLTMPQNEYMCVKNFKSDNDTIDLKYFSWPLITNIFPLTAVKVDFQKVLRLVHFVARLAR